MKEIDEEFTDDEIDQVIAEVSLSLISTEKNYFNISLSFQVDIDKSTTIDFNEFVKIMTF